jgi:hypothetical protein
MNFFRTSVIPVWIGLLAAGLLIWATEFLGSKIYPLPAGVSPEDPASLRVAMASLPTGALILVLVGWILGSFAGAWITARRVERSPIGHGLALGALLLIAALWDLLTFPHPVWFWVLGIAVFLPAAYLGARLARDRHELPDLPASRVG